MGTAAALADGGFPMVCADMQHGLHDERSLIDSVQMVHRAGAAPGARIPVGRFDLVSRILDAGAQFVIAPMINTVDDAQAFAAAAKYPPVGDRSWGPSAALDLWGSTQDAYLSSANDLVLAFAMIETTKAMENLDAILAVPGIDGVFVGPSDLSITLSDGERLEPGADHVLGAAEDIALAAKKAGKIAGVYAFDIEKARSFVVRGFSFVAISSDLRVLKGFAASSSDLSTNP